MATDISNLHHLRFFTQDSPYSHIGGLAPLEVAMIAVLPELAIMRPVFLYRPGEPKLSQQELKDLFNTLRQFLETLADRGS
jgi:hypothetical protein